MCRAVVRPRFAGRLFQEARETIGSMDAAGLVALSYVMANSVGGAMMSGQPVGWLLSFLQRGFVGLVALPYVMTLGEGAKEKFCAKEKERPFCK